MLMVVALQTQEEMRRVTEAFPDIPVYINASAVRPAPTHAEYADIGVALYNISIAKVAQIMMSHFLADCRERGADAFNTFMESDMAPGTLDIRLSGVDGFPGGDRNRARLPARGSP
jgi:2-methylisocitrate lyase-like PEP mutase family enzyme